MTNDATQQPEQLLDKITAKDVQPDHLATLQTQAVAIVDSLAQSIEDLSAISAVDNLGKQTQLTATGFLDRPQSDLNTRSILGPSSSIPAQIEKLRIEADRMNPNSIRHSAVFKMLDWVGLGDKAADYLLKEIYEHKDSIRQNIDGVTKGLLVTKAKGIENNVQLESTDREARQEVVAIRQNLNLLKFIAHEIRRRRDAATDEQTQNFLLKLHHRVVMRVQYLLMTEQMLMQYRIGISVVHEGNLNVTDAIDNLAYVVAKTLPIGLALRIAAADQARSLKIVRDAQELAIGAMEDTAGSVKQSAETLNQLISGDLTPMQRLEKTSEIMIAAAEQLKAAYQTGIENVDKQIPVFDTIRTRVVQYLPDDTEHKPEPRMALDAAEILAEKT